ncbi:unnamed protein product [Didymodactylos carnosus]|uniref:GP-PDE domain-containing protein n=1 Tax=Didymodactylos carnosus TaxID=1234261 RepID=A0A815YY04_9BILA|nr:unnamed protein product [Didymodactylos carnosus]CAF4441449.1 unnamed protein product [Didymodactylos carnosus]
MLVSKLSTRFPVFGWLPLTHSAHGSHRGGRHWGRENTHATYCKAVYEAKTNILEIDIWQTQDEHLVLNHDGVVNGNSLIDTHS